MLLYIFNQYNFDIKKKTNCSFQGAYKPRHEIETKQNQRKKETKLNSTKQKEIKIYEIYIIITTYR